MQKLVICYAGDAYGDSERLVRCIEYESVESFLVDFKKALDNADAQFLKDKTIYDDFFRKRKNKKCPPYPNNKFVFAGVEWNMDDFSNKRFLGDPPSNLLPEVFELEEWWHNKKEKSCTRRRAD